MISQCQECAAREEAENPQLLSRLDETIREYRDRPGGLIPVLQIAQAIFGWLPEAALKRISLGMEKSYTEVAGVVSFYSFFSTQPRGKYLIRVCLGTACYVRGGKRLLEAFKKELGIEVGGTTPDRVFSLAVARCFGACGLAPVIMVNDDIHQRVKEKKIRELLDGYRGRKDGGE